MAAHTIKLDEQTSFNRAIGTAAELAAANLVPAHLLPGQPGMDFKAVYLHNGAPAAYVRRLDSQADPESWIRIKRLDEDLYSVDFGIPREERKKRIAADRAAREARHAKWRAEHQAKVAAEARNDPQRERRHAEAKYILDKMPSSTEEYLQDFAETLRETITFYCERESPLKTRERFNGYMLTEESVDAILLACDALVDAVMDAEVTFDAALHESVIAKYRHQLAATDPDFQHRLGQLVAPNPKLLERSAS